MTAIVNVFIIGYRDRSIAVTRCRTEWDSCLSYGTAANQAECRKRSAPRQRASWEPTSRGLLHRHFRHHHPRHFGLSRQTPSVRMTRSAGSKTCPLTKSSTARSNFGRSGSIKSRIRRCLRALCRWSDQNLGNGLDPNFAFECRIGVIHIALTG